MKCTVLALISALVALPFLLSTQSAMAQSTELGKEDIDFVTTSLERYAGWARETLYASLPKKDEPVEFSGWHANAILTALNDGYRATGDERWLREFSSIYQLLIKFRADKQNSVNYEGIVEHQWYRIAASNIFGVSPFHKYDKKDEHAIVKLRGWATLKFSDVDHDGLYLEPALQFVEIVRSKQPHDRDMQSLAEEIVSDAQLTVASHEPEWVVEGDGGYYIFPRNSPFYLDGVEMPINEAAIFGSALVRLYEATGDASYLRRAEEMALHWLGRIMIKPDGFLYPYTLGAWNKGWTEEDKVSVNTPVAAPQKVPETFHKASLTIHFFGLLSHHSRDPRLYEFLSSVPRMLERSSKAEGIQLAFFPLNVDMSMPSDSFWISNPASFGGWSAAGTPSVKVWRRMYLMALAQMSDIPMFTSSFVELVANRPKAVGGLPRGKSWEEYFTPRTSKDDPAQECDLEVSMDTAVKLTLQAGDLSISRIWLTPEGFDGPGIRLSRRGDIFSGSAYLREGTCLSLRWSDRGISGSTIDLSGRTVSVTFTTLNE